jgi:exosome complex component CSL4
MALVLSIRWRLSDFRSGRHMENKKTVVPGESVGSEMEFLPGNGTFVENDEIYSTLTGEIREADRKLSVAQKKPLAAIGIGSVIIGTVENIVEPIALVAIRAGEHETNRMGENPDYSVLHASMIKRGYVKNVRDEYKIGDIIRAKVVDLRNGELRLSTDEPNLGAIKAFCSKCRHAMKLDPQGLACENPDCGWKDNRKVANDYRKADIDR